MAKKINANKKIKAPFYFMLEDDLRARISRLCNRQKNKSLARVINEILKAHFEKPKKS